jgi:membrane-bound metal-dependent hydrolase YbcI (DUF457 family)
MEARTHDAFAFAALITAAIVIKPQELNTMTLFASVVGNAVGALIPDLDQAGNKLWDILPAGNAVGKIFRHVFYKHRTISHSILGGYLIFKSLEWLLPKLLNPNYIDTNIVLWSMMIGFVSHLVADCLTKEGLPLLYPIKLNFGFPPFKALRITTGSWVENFIVLPAIGGYIVWVIWKFQSELAQIVHLVR